MKISALILAALLLMGSAAPTSEQTPSVIEQAQQATVLIEIPAEGDTAFFCTGVKVGIVRVLAARHCIPPETHEILINGSAHVRVVKQTDDKTVYDGLVLLEVPPQTAPILKLAEKEPKPGEGVVSIGYVDRVGTRVVLRRYVAGYGLEEANKVMAIDGTLIKGMSGGPVINERGELVGINQSVNGGIGLTTRLEAIKKFLK